MRIIGESNTNNHLTPDIFLEKICQPIVERKQNKKDIEKSHRRVIVFLNFNSIESKVEFDFESINAGGKKSKIEYLWIGDSIRHKLYCPSTTKKLDRLLTTTIPEIIATSSGEITSLKTVLNCFFNKKSDYFFIKPEMFDISEDERQKLIELSNILTSSISEQDVKKSYETLIKGMQSSILKFLNLSNDDISLFTLKVDGQLVCQIPQYKQMIYDEKIGILFDKTSKYQQKKAICSVCSNSGLKTTSDSTNFKFKLYMRDKVSFSSNLDGKFTKNYNICKNCYQHLLIAENFIATNLKTKIGGLSCYIIPHVLAEAKDFDIEEFSENIVLKSNSIVHFITLEEKLADKLDAQSSFVINYLFYYSPLGSNEFKVLKLIKDVPPCRLDRIRNYEEEIAHLVDDKFEGAPKFKIDLNKLWSCIPAKEVRTKQKKVESYAGTSRYLDLLDSIFSQNKINNRFVIAQFIETIQILKFERDGYNIKYSDNFVSKIIQLNFLLLFFKKLNLIEGFEMANINETDIFTIQDLIPEEILDYWNNIEIYDSNQKKSLFLLGYMIGEIGISQSSKDIKNKPILNKINFQGMGIEKLIRLANEVPEKLRQYRKFSYNENINTVFRILFESNLKNWNLSNQENVFYVLSGYSYLNYILWNRSKKNAEELFDEKFEKISNLKNEGDDVESFERMLYEARNLIYGEKKEYKRAINLLKQIYLGETEVKL